MSVYTELGLKEVINANGKMTILGASAVSDTIAENIKKSLQKYVVIEELIDYAGKVISEKTGAEAGCPTCGAASGMAIATAACIVGKNLRLIEKVPNTDGLANEIILQKGQNVNFGGNLSQMLRLGGGNVIEVGCANKVEREHIESDISEKTAALFYVKSHHAVQKGMQSLDTMVEIGRKYKIPVIADCAAEEDLRKYIAIGTDLVIYSGGKALEGPTCGFIAGNRDLVNACKLQYKGIGRAMKVSKEAMIGLISALNQYNLDKNDGEFQKELMGKVCNDLKNIDGISCRISQDEAGREIYRAEINIDEQVTGISAVALDKQLINGNPAIYLRNYYSNQGILSIDPRPLGDGDTEKIVLRIKHILNAINH